MMVEQMFVVLTGLVLANTFGTLALLYALWTGWNPLKDVGALAHAELPAARQGHEGAETSLPFALGHVPRVRPFEVGAPLAHDERAEPHG